MKKCLVSDESGHWYCIPADYKFQFNNLLEKSYDDIRADREFYDIFDKMRLNMHISNYCFENFEEIK